MHYSAWLVLADDIQHGCAIADISETGARIDVENADALPDRFVLLLAGNGSPRRRCRVIWRQQHQIGVSFEQRPAAADKTGLVPAMDADTEFSHPIKTV